MSDEAKDVKNLAGMFEAKAKVASPPPKRRAPRALNYDGQAVTWRKPKAKSYVEVEEEEEEVVATEYEEGEETLETEETRALEASIAEEPVEVNDGKLNLTDKDVKVGRVLYQNGPLKVYHAKQRETGLEFVLKSDIVRPASDEAERLQKELNHPNLLAYLGVLRKGEKAYRLLEFVGGDRLFDIVEKAKRLDEDSAKFYTAQLLSALSYIHGLGHMHANLKPGNLLLAMDGALKVADFPLVQEGVSLPESWVKNCYKLYAAPEVIKQSTTKRSADIWSIGCVLYNLVTGKPCFAADSELATLKNITEGKVEFPDQLSDPLKDLLQKILVVNPEDRLSSDGIKSHAFFDGFHWGDVDSGFCSPPNIMQRTWTRVSRASTATIQGQNPADANPEDLVPVSEEWQALLVGDERILHSSRILKRVGLSAKERQILITDLPRIFFVDTDKMEKKAEIEFANINGVKLRDRRNFEIATSSRTFYLRDLSSAGLNASWATSLKHMKDQLEDIQAEVVQDNLGDEEWVLLSNVGYVHNPKEEGSLLKVNVFVTSADRIFFTETSLSKSFQVQEISDVEIHHENSLTFHFDPAVQRPYKFEYLSSPSQRWQGVLDYLATISQIKEDCLSLLMADKFERIIFAGVVSKKRSKDVGVKKRILVATTSNIGQRIFNAQSGEDGLTFKGQIGWDKFTTIEAFDSKLFRITHKKDSFDFKCSSGMAKVWQKVISSKIPSE